jgi:hypothetical protein
MKNQTYNAGCRGKVLVCPLNWGLGHATRCVPVIRKYINEGYEVVIVSDGSPLAFLVQEFPQLRFIEFPSYPIRYSSGQSQVFAMFKSMPSILSGIISENKWLKKLVQNEHFDLIISDNRFGMYTKNIYSVYITHQLMVKMPILLKLLEPVVWRIHRHIIKKYNECWIPDLKGDNNLSGDLSHKYPLPSNAKFIGILSRFENVKPDLNVKRFSTVGIISGPEPQRSLFESEIIEKYRNIPTETLVISGKPTNEKTSTKNGFVTIVNHLEDEKFAGHLIHSEKIICRSGYSTIMDLKTLNCLYKTEFYPTPGQTEQKYLAELFKNNRGIHLS